MFCPPLTAPPAKTLLGEQHPVMKAEKELLSLLCKLG